MADTKIEWADAVWNPITGCTKVSAGCKNCYAERYANRQIGAFAWDPSEGPYRKFTDVRCHPERLEQPLHWRKPRKIFVNSMSDLFHEAVPDEFLHSVFGVMGQASQHTFQILTKRAARMQFFMQRFIQMPGLFPNVWLGVSVEDQEIADERIPLLLQTPAAVRFVSYEPALGPVTILQDWRALGHRFRPQADEPSICCCGKHRFYHTGLDWIIVGGESGPKARPMHPEWARSVRDQCQAAKIPFFMKQMSKREQIPEDLMIREFPNAR